MRNNYIKAIELVQLNENLIYLDDLLWTCGVFR